MRYLDRVCYAMAMVLTMCLVAGCGGPSYEGADRGEVNGTITLDGKPLPYGNVLFMGEGGRMASAVVQDGKYSIPEDQGPNVGEYKVQITGFAQAPPSSEEGANDNAPAPKSIVPAKYNTASELKVTIAGGPNTHDFTLTSQ